MLEALLAAVIIGLILILAWLGDGNKSLEGIHSTLEQIRRIAERWEINNSGGLDPMEPKPTNEERQRRDEFEQRQLRHRVESECGGWKMGRVLCRRQGRELFHCEFVFGTAERTYTADAHLGSFYRDGKAYMTQPLELDEPIRYALAKPAWGLGTLLVENAEGRILTLNIIEENAAQVGERISATSAHSEQGF